MVNECQNCGESFEAESISEDYCEECVGDTDEDDEEVDEEDDEY